MEHNISKTPLFIAQSGTPAWVPVKLHLPLDSFYRYEISFLQQLLSLPIYPDQTNVSLENTRAQVRYTLLPKVESLGFGLTTKQEEDSLPPARQKRVMGSTHQQITPKPGTAPAIQTLVLATKNHVKFELPGTRTPNCPIKSRELYH